MKLVFTSSSHSDQFAVAMSRSVGMVVVISLLTIPFTTTLPAAGEGKPTFDAGSALRGFVRPARSTGIHAEVPGRISAVLVAPGDLVQPGQVLVEMEDGEVATSAEASRIRFNHARSNLANVQLSALSGIGSKIRQEELRIALRIWESAQKRLGEFSMAEYENAWQVARSRLDSLRTLKDPPKGQQERLERILQLEARALEFARERWSRLREDAEIADWRLKVERMKLKIDETDALSLARAQYRDAMLELQAANLRSSRLRITAPRASTVLSVTALPGDRAYPGAPLVHMADLTSLEVEVPVSAKQISMVKAGDSVTVRLPLEPEMDLASSVASVSAVPDPQSHAYPVRIKIGNPKPGMILAGLDCAVNFPIISEARKSWWRRLLGL